jgi:hypothetical protein
MGAWHWLAIGRNMYNFDFDSLYKPCQSRLGTENYALLIVAHATTAISTHER